MFCSWMGCTPQQQTASSCSDVLAGHDGLVRIALKRPFSDGTVAIDLDPLSLLCRLAATVPAPRFHTVRYAGVPVEPRQVAFARRPQAR
ncbi:MAG TPA: transposase [Polyangiaceae bacterium]